MVNGNAPFFKPLLTPFPHRKWVDTTIPSGWECSVFATVRHTAVSCFYTSRCVTSCFQTSLRDTSLLFYCRIPSYRVNREFLFGHLTTKDSQGSSHLLLYCTIQSFPLGNPCLGYYDLCWLLTTSFTPSWYIEYIIFTMRPWDLLG